MPTTTTKVNTVRDNLNSNVLGLGADAMAKAPLGDVLSILLDTRNANTTIAATTIGAAVTPTSSATSQAAATTPANVAYAQADQTAIADLANALKTLVNLCVADIATLAARLNQARVDILALRSEMATINTAGTVGGATEAGITVTSHLATLAQAPTTNGLITVNGTAGTHVGVKKIIRDPSHTLATGEVFWDGTTGLKFATIDAISACDVIYAKSDLTQKVSCLLQDIPV